MKPPIDAIEYGRWALGQEVARLKQFEQDALAADAPERAERWRHLHHWIEFRILGDGTGCVLKRFDPRWADPEWRDWLGVLDKLGGGIEGGSSPPGQPAGASATPDMAKLVDMLTGSLLEAIDQGYLAEQWTWMVERESGRPWREASSGIVTHAVLQCLAFWLDYRTDDDTESRG